MLIRASSLRIGDTKDTKFGLSGKGKAVVGTALTDPVTGNACRVKGTATQS